MGLEAHKKIQLFPGPEVKTADLSCWWCFLCSTIIWGRLKCGLEKGLVVKSTDTCEAACRLLCPLSRAGSLAEWSSEFSSVCQPCLFLSSSKWQWERGELEPPSADTELVPVTEAEHRDSSSSWGTVRGTDSSTPAWEAASQKLRGLSHKTILNVTVTGDAWIKKGFASTYTSKYMCTYHGTYVVNNKCLLVSPLVGFRSIALTMGQELSFSGAYNLAQSLQKPPGGRWQE